MLHEFTVPFHCSHVCTRCGLHIFGLHSYGQGSYGLGSYGLNSYDFSAMVCILMAYSGLTVGNISAAQYCTNSLSLCYLYSKFCTHVCTRVSLQLAQQATLVLQQTEAAKVCHIVAGPPYVSYAPTAHASCPIAPTAHASRPMAPDGAHSNCRCRAIGQRP